RIERRQHGVGSLRIDVVEQQPHANAAIRGLQGFVGQQTTGQIVLPNVVLQVEAASRAARCNRAGGKGVEIVAYQQQAALFRPLLQEWRDEAVERRAVLGNREGERRLSLRPLGEASEGVDGEGRGKRQESESGSSKKDETHGASGGA